uniref:Uncharacterized protein n=1 Tax=Solanum lycopersicum TaxID=4081 RepID=A0A3Q7G8F2_SOLLC
MSYESTLYDIRDPYCVPTTLRVFAPISFPATLLAMPKSDILGFKSVSSKTLLALSLEVSSERIRLTNLPFPIVVDI